MLVVVPGEEFAEEGERVLEGGEASGLAFFTPSAVHHGQVEPLAAIRNDALARAYALHPERFVHGPPVTHLPPDAVYINPPETLTSTETKVH
jgi:hypothetical protein